MPHISCSTVRMALRTASVHPAHLRPEKDGKTNPNAPPYLISSISRCVLIIQLASIPRWVRGRIMVSML